MTIIVYFEVWSLAWIIPQKKHQLRRWVVTAGNMLPYFAFILEWKELGLTVQHHSAVPRDQDHISRVFPGFGGYFVAFSGVLNCGWPWHSIFVPEGGHVDVPATKYFLAFSEVSSPNMTCLYVQGPFTSMFSRILSLATPCTSYSARETGFCLCPAKLGWQPIDPAC